MTKKEIVKAISDRTGLPQAQVKEVVQSTFDEIIEFLVSGRRVELRNFGVFETKKRAERQARNPKTGVSVVVPERYVVTFKPGKEMEKRVGEIGKDTRFKESGYIPNPEPPKTDSEVGGND